MLNPGIPGPPFNLALVNSNPGASSGLKAVTSASKRHKWAALCMNHFRPQVSVPHSFYSFWFTVTNEMGLNDVYRRLGKFVSFFFWFD